MPFINLIAEQRQQKRARIAKTRGWFLTFLVVSGLGVASAGYLFIRVEGLKAEAKTLQARSQELKPLKDSIELYQRALTTLRPRLDTLGAARLDTERWTRILDHISLAMPSDTWLTRVNAIQPSEAGKPIEVGWTGMSIEQNLIGEFMLRMQRCPDMANVNLKYTELKRTPYGVGLEFQISAEVEGSAEQAPKGSVKS